MAFQIRFLPFLAALSFFFAGVPKMIESQREGDEMEELKLKLNNELNRINLASFAKISQHRLVRGSDT